MESYKKLLQKIDQYLKEAHGQDATSFVCSSDCANCCVGGISVWQVEYDNISEYLKASAGSSKASAKKDRCPFLNDKNRCSIYPARPIVCRLLGEMFVNRGIVLSTLAAINHVYCKERGFDPTERFKLGG